MIAGLTLVVMIVVRKHASCGLILACHLQVRIAIRIYYHNLMAVNSLYLGSSPLTVVFSLQGG